VIKAAKGLFLSGGPSILVLSQIGQCRKELEMKRQFTILVLLITLVLSGCGDKPLKFRNLLEADQYIRNNIENLQWENFKYLLSSSSSVTEKDFEYLQDRLTEQGMSYYHTEADNKFYRFDPQSDELVYMTEWDEENGILLLKDIEYIQ
jgi:hypothetical protein